MVPLGILVFPVVYMIAFIAPMRAILLAAFSFFPQGMANLNEVHSCIYYPFIPVFGELAPYWFDFYWGILSLVTIQSGGRRIRAAGRHRETAKILHVEPELPWLVSYQQYRRAGVTRRAQEFL